MVKYSKCVDCGHLQIGHTKCERCEGGKFYMRYFFKGEINMNDVVNPNRLKDVFESEPREALSPEAKDKIKNAFMDLEALLVATFPQSRLLSQVLTFLEIAAMYALRFL